MGLDIYVGSLTRYYAGDWETVVQRAAREQGMVCQILRPSGPDDGTRPPPSEIQELVLLWRQKLNEALADAEQPPLAWNESIEAPFFTDKPAWDCYGALCLWAAYDEHPGLERPEKAPESFSDDPAYKASNAEDFQSGYPNLLRGIELWLPCEFDFGFQAMGPTGQAMQFGSSIRLLEELTELNERTWRADEETIGDWRKACPDSQTAPLETKARYGYSILRYLARQSVEHNLPMKLDY
jgi:hypothetical protein